MILPRLSRLLLIVGITKMATRAGGVLIGDVMYTAEQYQAVFDGVDNYTFAEQWPSGVVPYEFESAFTESERETVVEAMSYWGNYTCIEFVERSSEANYIQFVKDDDCWSYTGMILGKQEISLDFWCFQNHIMLRIIGLALGMIHEHRRPDRDDYVTVLEENVESDYLLNFKKFEDSQVETYGIPYDYRSAMHYEKYAYSTNRRFTLQTTDPDYQDVIGKATSLSYGDIDAVSMMYSCPGHWTQWGAWSTCSAPCGTGFRSRRRLCSSVCVGSNAERNMCELEDCVDSTTPTITTIETTTSVPTTPVPTTSIPTTSVLTTTPLTTTSLTASTPSTSTSVSTDSTPTTPSPNDGRRWSFLLMSVDPATVYPGCSPHMRLRCSVISRRLEEETGERGEEMENESEENTEGKRGDEAKGRGREEKKLDIKAEAGDSMLTLAETRVDRTTEWTALLLMKGGQTVASVTYYDSTKQYCPTTLYGNPNPNVTVDGNLLFGAEHGFLEVTWTEPGLGQAGVYQCVGITDEITARGARVRHSTAPTAVNIAHLHDQQLISNLTEHIVYLEQQISERDALIEDLNEELSACGEAIWPERNCSAYGQCVNMAECDVDGSGLCQCYEGYWANVTECVEAIWPEQNCSANGQCVDMAECDVDGSGLCQCYEGYWANVTECLEAIWPERNCSAYGQCVDMAECDVNGSGLCQCYEGYWANVTECLEDEHACEERTIFSHGNRFLLYQLPNRVAAILNLTLVEEHNENVSCKEGINFGTRGNTQLWVTNGCKATVLVCYVTDPEYT